MTCCFERVSCLPCVISLPRTGQSSTKNIISAFKGLNEDVFVSNFKRDEIGTAWCMHLWEKKHNAKKPRRKVLVDSASNMQCYIVKKSLLHTTFFCNFAGWELGNINWEDLIFLKQSPRIQLACLRTLYSLPIYQLYQRGQKFPACIVSPTRL